jgi:predicted DNA-binding transcriptional regulator YafY
VRADRLISLIILLQAHDGLPAPTLARRLEVSVRTVMRDIEALSAAGIPVYTERGRRGGVRLLDGYRAGLAQLSHREGASLAVGQPRLAGDLGLGDALDTAMEKLTGAGGRALAGGLAHGRTQILIDVDPWMRTGEAVPWLPRIHDGLSRGRRLDLDYRDSEGHARAVTVDPLGLVAKAGAWYLVADAPPRAGGPGTRPALFRVSRVDGCAVRADASTRPPDFDLEATWAGLRKDVETRQRDLAVTVSVSPAALPMVRRLLAPYTRPPGERRPGHLLALSFGGVEHAVGMLIGSVPG